MDKINHPEEGMIDRWVVGPTKTGVTLYENDADGVTQQLDIPASQLDTVRDLLTETVAVAVEFDGPYGRGRTTQTLTLPSWCSGDPASGGALYLFGYATAAKDFNLTAEITEA